METLIEEKSKLSEDLVKKKESFENTKEKLKPDIDSLNEKIRAIQSLMFNGPEEVEKIAELQAELDIINKEYGKADMDVGILHNKICCINDVLFGNLKTSLDIENKINKLNVSVMDYRKELEIFDNSVPDWHPIIIPVEMIKQYKKISKLVKAKAEEQKVLDDAMKIANKKNIEDREKRKPKKSKKGGKK